MRAKPACALIVAANAATVQACNPDEALIAQHISVAINQQYVRQILTPVIGELLCVLVALVP